MQKVQKNGTFWPVGRHCYVRMQTRKLRVGTIRTVFNPGFFMEHPHPMQSMRLLRRPVASEAIAVAPPRQALTNPSWATPRWKQALARVLLAAGVLGALAVTAVTPAHAHSEASAVLSLLPVASVVAVAGGVSAAAGAVVAVPAALSVTGAVLVVKSVEASATGTLYVLERASDGARVSVEVVGRGVGASAQAVGTTVTCSVIGTGVVLSVAGEALAFVPNAIGRALLHNERL